MFIIIIARLMKPNNTRQEKKVALAYYSALENDKWGIINSSGETVITPSYDEMIVVPDKEKAVFIVTYDVDYATGAYKTKAVNAKTSNYSVSMSKLKQSKIMINKTIYGMKKDA